MSVKLESTTSQSQSLKLVLETLVWSVLTLIAWWWVFSTASNFTPSITFTSMVSIAAGVRIFYGHGRGIVSATGLFGLSTSIFIGFSGLLLIQESSSQAGWSNLALASVIGLTAQIGTSVLAWGSNTQEIRKPFWVGDSTAVWLSRVGTAFLVISVAIHIGAPQLKLWTEAAAFTSICILASGYVLRERARLFSWRVLVILSLVLLYSEFFHSGSGRLRIVALACAVAVIFSARFPWQRLKFLIILALPIAIAWLADSRLEFQESLSAGASEGRTGLESMTAPLDVLSLLVKALQDDQFVPVLGYNLLSVVALVIPESVWPSQPISLGYELVQFVSPEKYGDGVFSTAGTSTGEGLFNFGWLGIVIVMIVSAVGLRLLDSSMFRLLQKLNPTVLGVLGLVFAAMLAGALADYTWSGIHTYAARMITRLPVFLCVLIIARLSIHSKRSPEIPLHSTVNRQSPAG